MADPLLDGKYPIKGLYQALAIAAMCLQEEADTRPVMSDVVTALEYLTKDGGEAGPENSINQASPSAADRHSGGENEIQEP